MKSRRASSLPEIISGVMPVTRWHLIQDLVLIADVPKGGGGEDPRPVYIEVFKELPQGFQGKAGPLDPRLGQPPLFHIPGKPRHHLFPDDLGDDAVFLPKDGKTDGV